MEGPALEMERLVAGTWRTELAPQALAIYGDPEVVRMIHREPTANEADTCTWIRSYIERNAAFPMGCGIWPLFEQSGGALVGCLLLKPFPERVEIEVGWHLGRFAWGKGYATEAGRAAVRYGFETLGLETIYAVTLPQNTRSMNVCRRVGMRHIGRTDRFYNMRTELFSVRRDDVDGAQQGKVIPAS